MNKYFLECSYGTKFEIESPEPWTETIGGTPDFSISFEQSPLTIQFETEMSKKTYKKIKKEAKRQKKAKNWIYDSAELELILDDKELVRPSFYRTNCGEYPPIETRYQFDWEPGVLHPGMLFKMNGELFECLDVHGSRIESKKIESKKVMKNKKHKINIPEGYEVTETIENMYRDEFDKDITTHITVNLKPTKKELPKTWEEYFKANGSPAWVLDEGVIPDCHTALGKLEILRDVYNDGWEPDWHSVDPKYCLCICDNKITPTLNYELQSVLAFEEDELRYEFLKNFTSLIETAKPFL